MLTSLPAFFASRPSASFPPCLARARALGLLCAAARVLSRVFVADFGGGDAGSRSFPGGPLGCLRISRPPHAVRVCVDSSWSQVLLHREVLTAQPPSNTDHFAFLLFYILRQVAICFSIPELCRPGLPQTRNRSTCLSLSSAGI